MKWLMLIVLGLSYGVNADVYKWTDNNGQAHFSDRNSAQFDAEKIHIKTITSPASEVVSTAHASEKLIMYSTSTCGYSKAARDYFHQHSIAFEERDIEQSPEALRQYKQLNATRVPVILMGNRRLNGFSTERFQAFYERE